MITVYAKATNRCNVGCSHCYLPESVRANRSRMTDATLENLGAFLTEMQVMARHAGSHVIWHGGEPLVLSPDYYFRAGEALDRMVPGHTESIQTSMIPYHDRFAELFLTRFGGFAGTSVDFSQRKIQGSVEAYHQLFMKKVDLARGRGIRIIPGVVPTRNEIGRERDIVAWFVERSFPAFNVDRYNAYAQAFPDRPSNREHSAFLSGLLDAVLERMESDGRAPVVGALRAGVMGVLYGLGGDRWGGTCMSDFIVVEPDGSLNNCPDKSTVEESFGNVRDGFRAFSANRFRRKWVRHQNFDHKKSWCLSCENAHFCKSGCPITPNGPEEGDADCSGYKPFLTHVRDIAARPDGRAVLEAYIRQDPEEGMAGVYDRALSGAEPGACAA